MSKEDFANDTRPLLFINISKVGAVVYKILLTRGDFANTSAYFERSFVLEPTQPKRRIVRFALEEEEEEEDDDDDDDDDEEDPICSVRVKGISDCKILFRWVYSD